ncbi:hypothetical protein Tco_0977547 [Tanacetum coccineum]|uniref:Uncharacterized protein n=1 Tax=Tanacetum coccineum TaxID=301880 RepID=A0ABQ5EKE5_9ASTR
MMCLSWENGLGITYKFALNFPFTYLGLPINCNMSRCKGWDSIIEKFTRKLSKWKANLLSIGGRSTLITSVLGTLAWNLVLASKPKGGLGIGSLLALNLALIQKWRQRYVNNPDSLWVKLINQIHGSYQGDLISIKITECMVFGPRLRVALTLCTTRTSSLFPPSRSKSTMIEAQNSGMIFGYVIPLLNRSSLAYIGWTFTLIVRCMINGIRVGFGLGLEVSMVVSLKLS